MTQIRLGLRENWQQFTLLVVVNVFVVSFFLWHLSGSQAIEYAGGGHGDHGHGEHAH